jgi:hypothetical protein
MRAFAVRGKFFDVAISICQLAYRSHLRAPFRRARLHGRHVDPAPQASRETPGAFHGGGWGIEGPAVALKYCGHYMYIVDTISMDTPVFEKLTKPSDDRRGAQGPCK